MGPDWKTGMDLTEQGLDLCWARRSRTELDWCVGRGIFFSYPCYNVLIAGANYMSYCSTFGSTIECARPNDAVANLHCVNTKWVI